MYKSTFSTAFSQIKICKGTQALNYDQMKTKHDTVFDTAP